ncbi:unnamed protein product, partial [Timema podura]|nr:unnamed protein product [Timema podura]
MRSIPQPRAVSHCPIHARAVPLEGTLPGLPDEGTSRSQERLASCPIRARAVPQGQTHLKSMRFRPRPGIILNVLGHEIHSLVYIMELKTGNSLLILTSQYPYTPFLASVAWNNEDAPLNIGVPDYTDSFESNEGIYLLEITGGSVHHIENVGRATDVIVDPNEDYVLGSNLQVNGAVMKYRYDVSLLNGVTLERGELTVTINGVEADFDVNVYLVGGPAGYYATLGTVKTTAI